MAKEVQSDEVNKLITLGEEKGFLTYDDVNDALLPDITSAEQLDDIISLFGEKNIDIIDTEQGEKLTLKKSMKDIGDVSLKDALALVPSTDKTGDPVKMYLREMGSVSLLSREGEVEIAKKIEEGARETMSAIFRLSVSIDEVLNIGDKLLSGELRSKNVVDNVEDEEGFIEITNRFLFTNLSEVQPVWLLQADNEIIEKGEFSIDLPAQMTTRVKIPFHKPKIKEDTGYHLLVSYRLKDKTAWAEKGFEIAWDQVELPWLVPEKSEKKQIASEPACKEENGILTISGNFFTYKFKWVY